MVLPELPETLEDPYNRTRQVPNSPEKPIHPTDPPEI